MSSEQEILASKRPVLELRCGVIGAVRAFFQGEGFMEVETPIRTMTPAPERHIEAIPADGGYFLITSPELYMKRLLAAGYEKIFQISKVFRKGERGRLHHTEFSMLEWYRIGATYVDLQLDCKRLLSAICNATGHIRGWFYRDRWLDVTGDWQRLTVKEAFARYAGWEPGMQPDEDRFDLDLVEKVEPRLGFPAPAVLCDYPASQAALARLKAQDPAVAERFELYWAGIELANGFSELNDAKEQRARFEETLDARRQAGLAGYPVPETFLSSLDHLPACAGIALGLDRLVMLLGNAPSLDEAVAFPPDPEAF